MKRKKKNQIPNINIEDTESNESEEPKTEKKKKRFGRKKQNDQIVRIEELEKMMEKYGDDVDPEDIVSMYIPHRRSKQIGAALLRMDKLHLTLLGMLLLVAVLFIFAFMQEKMGNFTINLNRLELFRRGVAIADNGDFNNATARLAADALDNGTNIAAEDLPDNLDDIDGSHNGKNYVAYTFYIRNAGKTDLGYSAKLKVVSASKGVEKAARVRVYRNGEPTTYAATAADAVCVQRRGDHHQPQQLPRGRRGQVHRGHLVGRRRPGVRGQDYWRRGGVRLRL